jgi:hypothetical protein
LENVERVFRGLNTELLIRSIRHGLDDRVRAHVLIRMLAYEERGTIWRSPRLFRSPLYQRGEIGQRPGYADNPFRPR